MSTWNGIQSFVTTVTDNIENVIIGKRSVIEKLMVALFCEGHVLLEDIPGVGKTMLARSLAVSLSGSFKRVQCTPDLLPNDITGVSVYNQHNGAFEFLPGPVFVNILLSDEINRATPRTQASLLEAMQERQVTVDGITHKLPRPFIVLATQNPIEYEGTFPLPEAQLDRFLMCLSMGYPEPKDEKRLFSHLKGIHPIDNLGEVADGEAIIEFQKAVWEVHMDDSLQDYILNLITATRMHHDITLGASPRATIALFKASQALAAIRGRGYVLPDDIQELVPLILKHRLIISPEASLRGRTQGSVLQDILESTPLKLETEELKSS